MFHKRSSGKLIRGRAIANLDRALRELIYIFFFFFKQMRPTTHPPTHPPTRFSFTPVQKSIILIQLIPTNTKLSLGIKMQATLAEGECSHHCAIPAPQLLICFNSTFSRTIIFYLINCKRQELKLPMKLLKMMMIIMTIMKKRLMLNV